METMTPEECLSSIEARLQNTVASSQREWWARMFATIRSYIANQQPQPEPVPYVDWPSVEAVQGGQHVWTAEYKGARQEVLASLLSSGTVYVGTTDGRVQLRDVAPTKFLPCTVTPHPALEPERVEPRPLRLLGRTGVSGMSWHIRHAPAANGNLWIGMSGYGGGIPSELIFEVNESASDPEAVALWRSEGGGQ